MNTDIDGLEPRGIKKDQPPKKRLLKQIQQEMAKFQPITPALSFIAFIFSWVLPVFVMLYTVQAIILKVLGYYANLTKEYRPGEGKIKGAAYDAYQWIRKSDFFEYTTDIADGLGIAAATLALFFGFVCWRFQQPLGKRAVQLSFVGLALYFAASSFLVWR